MLCGISKDRGSGWLGTARRHAWACPSPTASHPEQVQQWPDPEQGLLRPMLLRLSCAGEWDGFGFVWTWKTEMYRTKLIDKTQAMPSSFNSEVIKSRYARRSCAYWHTNENLQVHVLLHYPWSSIAQANGSWAGVKLTQASYATIARVSSCLCSDDMAGKGKPHLYNKETETKLCYLCSFSHPCLGGE